MDDQAPAGGGLSWVEARLLERRVVFLRGGLDDELVGRVAAELMMLDASGDDPVKLQLDSPGGSLQAGFSLMDTIEALGVAVHASCVGRAEGAAVGVFAVADRRLAAPHARFRLAEPPAAASGHAAALSQFADHHQAQLSRFVAVVARATGRPAEHVEADMAVGRWLGAEEAVAYGLADGIWETPRQPRGAPEDPPGGRRRPPFGFTPPSGR